MINISLTMFVPLTAKKTGEFHVHQLGQIFTNILSDFHPDHLKNPLRLLLNLLENTNNFWYANFNFHGCFSFLFKVMGLTLFKGKAPFFLPLQNLHKKLYTTFICT